MARSGKVFWLLVNLFGGAAVIGSYLYGFLTRPGAAQVLWGSVPAGLRPIYTANMFLAAAGYLVCFYFLLRQDAARVKVFDRNGFGVWIGLYLLILVPSALWMPLTLLAVERSSNALLWLVRVDLALVAAGSLGLLLATWKIQPPRPAGLRRLALAGPAVMHRLVLAGLVFLCLQTVLLDALVWSALFRL